MSATMKFALLFVVVTIVLMGRAPRPAGGIVTWAAILIGEWVYRDQLKEWRRRMDAQSLTDVLRLRGIPDWRKR